MRVLICGGGAIGASLAYFLAERGAEPVVIERSGVANAASGKSGGFLALDWCDRTPLAALARRSFALHESLAETLGNPWGYRRLETLQILTNARQPMSGVAQGWLGAGAAVYARLGAPETTAQVEPAAFTRGLLEAARRKGARLEVGEILDLRFARDGWRVTGVTTDSGTLEGDAVVIAMGPWSNAAGRWLPLPAVYGLKGHSLVFAYRPPGPPQALFVEHEAEDGSRESPEVFPRADGTTYICGVSSRTPLPADPGAVEADPGAHERLRATAACIAPGLAEAELLAAGACYRPVTEDGLPLLGPVTGVEDAYVATGHNVWGILNAPASGEALAALITEGEARPVDLEPFDPSRLLAFDRVNPL